MNGSEINAFHNTGKLSSSRIRKNHFFSTKFKSLESSTIWYFCAAWSSFLWRQKMIVSFIRVDCLHCLCIGQIEILWKHIGNIAWDILTLKYLHIFWNSHLTGHPVLYLTAMAGLSTEWCLFSSGSMKRVFAIQMAAEYGI